MGGLWCGIMPLQGKHIGLKVDTGMNTVKNKEKARPLGSEWLTDGPDDGSTPGVGMVWCR